MDKTQSLQPGEIIRNGEVVLATCATCCYFDGSGRNGFGKCLSYPLREDVHEEGYCSIHPLRDPQVAIAEQQKRIADALETIVKLLEPPKTLQFRDIPHRSGSPF